VDVLDYAYVQRTHKLWLVVAPVMQGPALLVF